MPHFPSEPHLHSPEAVKYAFKKACDVLAEAGFNETANILAMFEPTSVRLAASSPDYAAGERQQAFAAWHDKLGFWLPSVRSSEEGAVKQTYGGRPRPENSDYKIVPIEIRALPVPDGREEIQGAIQPGTPNTLNPSNEPQAIDGPSEANATGDEPYIWHVPAYGDGCFVSRVSAELAAKDGNKIVPLYTRSTPLSPAMDREAIPRIIDECANVARDYQTPHGKSDDYESGFIDASNFIEQDIRALQPEAKR